MTVKIGYNNLKKNKWNYNNKFYPLIKASTSIKNHIPILYIIIKTIPSKMSSKHPSNKIH